MKIVATALAAVLFAGAAVSGGSASAAALQAPGPVAASGLHEARAVKVCRTRLVKHYHRYWPHRPYWVKVKTCHWT